MSDDGDPPPGPTARPLARVVDPFTRALTGLAARRPLATSLVDLLDHAMAACGATHGYAVARLDGSPPDEVVAGRGAWAGAVPHGLDRIARGSGQPRHEPHGWEHVNGPVLLMPVYGDDEIVGSLGLGYDPEQVSDLDPVLAMEKLLRFEPLVAVAVAHARDLETERAARAEEQALLRAGRALSSTLELSRVLPRILEELRQVVPFDTASVQELRGDHTVIVGGHGIDVDLFAGVGFDAVQRGTPNADVIQTRLPVIVPDIFGQHPYPQFPHPDHAISGVRGWMGIPLVFGGKSIGMLTLDSYQPGFYNEEHARIAMRFAAQAAIAMENARAYELSQREVAERTQAEAELIAANAALEERMAQIEALQENLREQAVRDPLTGLFNRRYLMETLAREVTRSRRQNRPLTVAMIDVDRFKRINDSHGHVAGDRVLTMVANVLAGLVREGDVVCRYGGEEFVVLLPDLSAELALQRAEGWRMALAERQGDNPAAAEPVTISVGVASIPDNGDTGEEVIAAADAAMYRAKRNGRDQVALA